MAEQKRDYSDVRFTTMEALRETMPLWMAYETKENGKEGYNRIQAVFRDARAAAGNMNFADNAGELADYMEALADCCEEIDEEVFDHYKNLEAAFKEALHRLADPAVPGKLRTEIRDPEARRKIGRAILKACGRRMILEEKYRGLGSCLAEEKEEEKR